MKKNKCKWAAVLFPVLFFAGSVSAQTKIVDNTIIGGPDNASALLELQSNNKGFLPPRVALIATNNIAPLTESPLPAGMLVYNTAIAGAAPNNVTPGYYYYNGTLWVKITDGWNLLGNAHTVDGTNFIGTTDGVPLTFRVGNVVSGKLDPGVTGNVSFGWGSLPVSATQSSAFGEQALMAATKASFSNTAVGFQALNSTTSGSFNTGVGQVVLAWNTTGSYNTAIGYHSGPDVTYSNLTNATAIGAYATVTKSNCLILGGTVPTIGPPGMTATSVGIDNTAPNSTLQVSGSVATALKVVTASYSITASDFTILVNGKGTIVITLPSAVGCTGRIYKIKNLSTIGGFGGSIVSVAPPSGQKLEGSTSSHAFSAQYIGITVQSDGTGWWIMQ